jgi:HicB-like protein involved in pilus formation
MDLTPYVDQLRRDLVTAAEAGGDEARALAERLTAPLESSVRLALLSALSQAAEEITRQLAPGAVDVRLRGSDLGFAVTHPPIEPPAGPADDSPAPETFTPQPQAPAVDIDEGGTLRITLRLPEQLKSRVDEAAARLGVSVNTWLVRAVANAMEPRPRPSSDSRRGRWSGGSQYTGWAR